MKTNQIVGIVLLGVGGALLYYGYQESQAFSSQVAKAFSGSPTNTALWKMIGGGGLAGLGLFLAAFKK